MSEPANDPPFDSARSGPIEPDRTNDPPFDCHPGHRVFVGGFLDGHVDHLTLTTLSDYPLMFRYPNGSLYARDLDGGTTAIYRHLTDHDEAPRG